VTVEAIDPLPLMGILRLNPLPPPFNDRELRRALLPAIVQSDFMAAIVGTDPAMIRDRAGAFTPGTPYAGEAGLEPLLSPRSPEEARAALRAAGYANQPMRLIGPTDILAPTAMTQVAADLFRRLGFNMDLALSDWGTVIQRRASREPLDKGGWSALLTSFTSYDFLDPALHPLARGNGLQGWPGWPTIPRLEELRRGVAEAEGRRDAVIARGEAARREWEAGLGPAVAWTAVDPVAVKSKNGATLTRREDLSIVASGEDPIKDVHEVTIKTDAVGLTGLRLEMLADDSLPHRGPGRAPENGNFYLNRVEGEAVSVTDPSRSTPLVFTTAEADYSQPGCDVSGAIDGDPATGWASQFTPSRDLAARFGLATPVGYVGGTEIRLRFRYESVHPQHTPGRYRLSLGRGSMLPAAVAAALAVEASGRSPEQAKAVDEQWRKSLEVPVAASRRSLSDFESTLPEAMVMAERPDPRETAILIRGAWDKPGEKVSAGVPAKLPPLPADAPKNRLSLARWVVDPANPLTARVAVNRAWQTLMGTGLVKTVEDFGTQGDLPSHPELLDWLATEFVRTGWDVKALHRLIVTSGTYRQSSKVTPQLIERDPENRLLARGPRYRLSSLLLRDQALAASGLLVPTVGGPPVRPYQPPGIWEELSFGTIKYDQDAGEKLYRRSLYTYWRRTIGPTDLFDASARQTCAVRQSRTNTPIHALISLNDTAYVEAARVLAERAVAEAGQGASDRLDRLFRLAAARKPVEAERRVLIRAYERLLGQYRADPAATSKRLAVGQKPRRDPGTDAAELAALSEVAALVLNLDEVLSKE